MGKKVLPSPGRRSRTALLPATAAQCTLTPVHNTFAYLMNIRAEMPSDAAGIRAVQVAAFPTSAEADLVEQLRSDTDLIFSLAATRGEQIVGHVVFSRMRMPPETLGLGPVAVLRTHRKKGIAEALIRHGLQRAREDGWKWVFVLGGDYYRRFGFDAGPTNGLASPYAGPHLMGLALQPDELRPSGERLEYANAFAALE